MVRRRCSSLSAVKSLSFSKLVECVCVLVECALFWRRCESDAARILCTLVKTAPQHIYIHVYFSGDLMNMYSVHQLQQLWKVSFSLRSKAELDMASILVSVASAAVCNSNCKCNQVAAANGDQVEPAKRLWSFQGNQEGWSLCKKTFARNWVRYGVSHSVWRYI